MRYQIKHLSRYQYSAPARGCVMLLCLKPRADRGQRLHRFDLATRPAARFNPEPDPFGNTRHVLNLHRVHGELEITATSGVTAAAEPQLPARLGGADAWAAVRADADAAHWHFTRPSALAQPSAALAAFVARHGIQAGDDPLEALLRLSETLHRNLHYTPGSTGVESSIEHILATGEGVCQDYAHLFIAIARGWGVPARYVMGYLHLLGGAGEQAPENATHAWVECRLPGLGWVGFDPTNHSLAGAGHIRIAVGRDFGDVSPTRGIFRGDGETRLTVDVRVRKVPLPAAA